MRYDNVSFNKKQRYTSRGAFEQFDQWHRLPELSKRYNRGVIFLSVTALIGGAYVAIFMFDHSDSKNPNGDYAFSKLQGWHDAILKSLGFQPFQRMKIMQPTTKHRLSQPVPSKERPQSITQTSIKEKPPPPLQTNSEKQPDSSTNNSTSNTQTENT